MKVSVRMKELAKSLFEYSVLRAMGRVVDVSAPKLIAELGNAKRFHNGKALIAYAGINALSYKSERFIGTERKISKRESATLIKVG